MLPRGPGTRITGLEELLVGETAGEGEQQDGDKKIKDDDPGIVALVGFDEAAAAFSAVDGHG